MDQSLSGGERVDFNAGVFNTPDNAHDNVSEMPADTSGNVSLGEIHDGDFRNIGEAAVGMGDILPMPEVVNNPENQIDASGALTSENSDVLAAQAINTGDTDTVGVQLATRNDVSKKDEQIKALSLTGEMIDKEAEKELKQKIEEYKKSPYELENYRDEMMAKSLKSSFGRIYGKSQGDDGANIAQFSTNQGGRKAA